VALAAAAALAAFVLANPCAIFDRHTFVADLGRLQRFTVGAPLVGQVERNGWAYYLESSGWALGIVPAFAAGAGLLLLAVRRRPQAVVLAPFAICFVLYMGFHSRFYARWMLPLYPVLAIAAAHAGVTGVDRLRRARMPEGLATALVAAGLILPALVPTVRNARTLAREDTRSQARTWLVDHVPRGARVVFEPSAPEEWYGVTPGGGPDADRHRQWRRFHRDKAIIAEQARSYPGARVSADFLNYERTLSPGLVGVYARRGYCWVVTVSDQSGAAHAEPHRVPHAIAYYRRLRRESRVAFVATPGAAALTPPGAARARRGAAAPGRRARSARARRFARRRARPP
jgi:hypothetical protein